jgi:biopolymer transport protein ExbB
MEPTAVATPAVAANISILDLVQQGWYATYPLILFSVIVVSVVIDRFWTLRSLGRAIEGFTDQICKALQKGDIDSATTLIDARLKSSPAARIYAALMPLIRKGDVEEILEFGERRRLEEGRGMRRNVWVLGTVAASAPFIGLFGTVIGIIKAFHQMAVMGTGGFAVVAAGISEALVATALGLLVAIVALICFNFFQVMISNIDTLLRVGLGRVLESAEIGGVHGAQ